MSADLQIEPYGGGAWDLVLSETEHGLDAVLVGDTAATHQAAVLQRLTYALLVWLGESIFDRSVGFPWEQGVFGRAPIEGIPAYLQEHAEAVDGVEGLIDAPSMFYDADARRLRIELEVQGQGFTINFEQELTG
jgi:hypothetical protein